jgi:hypothetical protein
MCILVKQSNGAIFRKTLQKLVLYNVIIIHIKLLIINIPVI